MWSAVILLCEIVSIKALFTCSVISSTSEHVAEAKMWSGGKRCNWLVCTSPQSDKAVHTIQHISYKINSSGLETNCYRHTSKSISFFLPLGDKTDSLHSCILGRSDTRLQPWLAAPLWARGLELEMRWCMQWVVCASWAVPQGCEGIPGLGTATAELLRPTWVKGQSGLEHRASNLQFGWTKRHLSPNLQLGKVL